MSPPFATPRPPGDQPTGLCLTCHYIKSELVPYTCAPWWHSYHCTKTKGNAAPHAERCLDYVREPGAD